LYPRFLSLQEVCEILELSEGTVRKLFKNQELPAKKVGGQWRLRSDLLDEYLAIQRKDNE